jgi:hypothetical protein
MPYTSSCSPRLDRFESTETTSASGPRSCSTTKTVGSTTRSPNQEGRGKFRTRTTDAHLVMAEDHSPVRSSTPKKANRGGSSSATTRDCAGPWPTRRPTTGCSIQDPPGFPTDPAGRGRSSIDENLVEQASIGTLVSTEPLISRCQRERSSLRQERLRTGSWCRRHLARHRGRYAVREHQ